MRQEQEITEEDLAGLCAKGNAFAQKELYTRYAERIHALCARYFEDQDKAKDFTHDIVLKIYDSIGRFRYLGKGSLWAWIKRIAVNAVINNIKHEIKVENTIHEATIVEIIDPKEDDIDIIPAEELLKMILELPYTQRLIMNMFCFDNYSHKEIARSIGITEKASASLLSKARKALKVKMNDYLKR